MRNDDGFTTVELLMILYWLFGMAFVCFIAYAAIHFIAKYW